MHPQLPNALTLLRIALIPVLVAAFYLPDDPGRWIALTLFAVAGITDWLDGQLARAMRVQSSLGQMLDPIADKLIVAAALVMLVAEGPVTGLAVIPVIIILCREIMLSGLREYLAHVSVSVPVTQIAKVKTAIQMIAIGILIGGDPLAALVPGALTLGFIALWGAAIVTVYTGWSYLEAGLQHVDAKPRADQSASAEEAGE